MTRRTLFALLVSLSLPLGLFAAPVAENTPGRHLLSFPSPEGRREYIVHVPAGYDGKKPLPLVVMLHGRGGNAGVAECSYGWVELAKKEGFILCFASALPDRNGIPTWNAGYNAGRRGEIDTVFLSGLITRLKSTLAVDSRQVYLCGHSSGAMMSYRFGAEKSEAVAAIGVIAGSIGNEKGGKVPRPATPVSVIHFHGKEDPTVPYDYRVKPGEKPGSNFVPAPESVRFFAEANGCDKSPKREESFKGNILKETFAGGKSGSEVVLYSIGDGNHKWPGGAARTRQGVRGKPNDQINATALMWEFFRAHPRQ